MSERKPNLPDPGHDRWWEITYDENFELNLFAEGEGSYCENGVVLATEYIEHPAEAYKFEQAAREILARLDKVKAFVGTYNKPEENN